MTVSQKLYLSLFFITMANGLTGSEEKPNKKEQFYAKIAEAMSKSIINPGQYVILKVREGTWNSPKIEQDVKEGQQKYLEDHPLNPDLNIVCDMYPQFNQIAFITTSKTKFVENEYVAQLFARDDNKS